MTEKVFAVISNILSAMPSNQPWDDRVSMAYAVALRDWDDKVAQKAVMSALKTKKWRPSPAELREVALEVKRVRVPWHTAQEQIRHVVIHHPPVDRERAVKRLIEEGKVSPSLPIIAKYLGGWNSIGLMSEVELTNNLKEAVPQIAEDKQLDAVLSEPLPAIEAGKTIKMIGD